MVLDRTEQEKADYMRINWLGANFFLDPHVSNGVTCTAPTSLSLLFLSLLVRNIMTYSAIQPSELVL